MEWHTYLENMLDRGMKEFQEFQDRRFFRAFCLKHGREIVHATHDLARLRLGHQLEAERKALEVQLKLLDSAVRPQVDRIVLAEREVEQIASFSGHVAGLKREIRSQHPEDAEEIIENFQDILEARLNGNGKEGSK